MSLWEGLSLFAALAVLALVPSSSVALVVARSSTAGFANGAAVAAGIVLGDLAFVCLAAFGMTALAERMGGFFLIIRYLAGAYLIWIGISLLRSGTPAKAQPAGLVRSSLTASFLSGFLITLGDVKAIFFYASLLPAFVDLASLKALDFVLIIALTIVGVGGVKLGYAFAARRLASLAGRFGAGRGATVAAGGVLVGAGTYLIVKA